MIKIEFKNGAGVLYENPVKVKELIAKEDYNFFACKINNKLRDFEYVIDKNCMIDFVGLKDRDASKVYESSLRYILLMAAYRVDPDLSLIASFNVSRSTMIRNKNGEDISEETFNKIKAEMENIVSCDYPIVRKTVTKNEAIEVYTNLEFHDKLDLMKYRPEDEVHIYSCDGYQNYLYSYMTPSTGYLKKYNLIYHKGRIVLMYPRSELKGGIPKFIDEKTYASALEEVREWGKVNSSATVQQINEHIESGDAQNFVLSCENRHNQMLEELTNKIVSNPEIGLIAIAGPSSSGKTTFSNRLKTKLMERGINPVVISMDDYYKDRDPDEDEVTDLEDINLLDIPLFNENMRDLLDGKEVEMPKFDFARQKRLKGKTLKLEKNSPIVIEGIHALNKRMTELVPDNKKFKIYIGPQIQVNLDNHNPISITHLRLIRRMVRDYQFRGASAENTLKMWESVRNGEFKWIYENQEGVDYVFNSELDYEFCVTKKHVLPLIKEIKPDSPYYNLANTLKKYVKYFKDIDDECVPRNSLLREFIGGSCFNV